MIKRTNTGKTKTDDQRNHFYSPPHINTLIGCEMCHDKAYHAGTIISSWPATRVGQRAAKRKRSCSPHSGNCGMNRSRKPIKSMGFYSTCICFYLLSVTCSTLESDAARDQGKSRYLRSAAAAATPDVEFNPDFDSSDNIDFVDRTDTIFEPSSPIEEEFDYETFHARHHIPVPALGVSLTGWRNAAAIASAASTSPSSVQNTDDDVVDNDTNPSQVRQEQYHRLLEVDNSNSRGIMAFAGTMQAMEMFANNAAVNDDDGSILIKDGKDWPSPNSGGAVGDENNIAMIYEGTLAQISKYRSSLLHPGGSSTATSSEEIQTNDGTFQSQIANETAKDTSHKQTPILNKQWPKLPRTDSDLDRGRYLVGLEVRSLQSHQRIIIDYQDVAYGSIGFEDQQVLRPLRIQYLLPEISNGTENDASKDNMRLLSTLLETSFNRTAILWSKALSLTPVIGNIIPTVTTCGSATIPLSHREVGVENADIVIYITGDNKYCGGAIMHSAVCDFDQNMRPLVANINVCTKNLPTTTMADYTDGIAIEVLNDYEVYISTETSRILGASTSLLQHYRNPDTGIPFGTTEKHIHCVDGTQETMSLPNIIGEDVDLNGQEYFEIRTPKLTEVVRNHFSCMTLTGARLERKRRVSSCIGSFLDEVSFLLLTDLSLTIFHCLSYCCCNGSQSFLAQSLFFGEQMSGFQVNNQGAIISPLTLALLEDSSWFIANYTLSTEMPFGRGAGCSFARDACKVNADGDIRISAQGKGFHCDEIGKMGCSATHSHKARCDFLHPTSISSIHDDVCPMYVRGAIDCANSSNGSISTHPGEVYSKSSKCFLTTEGEPLCLQATCNKDRQGIDIHYENELFACVHDDQIFDTKKGLLIKCPRIAAVCPSLICPSNCAARGVCDEDRNGKHTCICDDPFDSSPGCWG